MEVYTGRRKITIPLTQDEFNQDIINSLKKYISGAVGIHNLNVAEIKYLHKQYLGEQDILTEKRRYDASQINNVLVENHLWKLINFKVGFMYGNPLEYANTNTKKIDVDDMSYLNLYFKDVSKDSLDIKKAQDLYEFGIAYQLVIPSRTGFDDGKAPFELYSLDVKDAFLVYSADTISVPLFGVILSHRKVNPSDLQPSLIYEIYLPNRKIEIRSGDNAVIKNVPQPYNYIPIQEFCLNEDRVGIIEVVLLLQNTINKNNSLQLDDFEQTVNSLIALLNQKVDDDFYEMIKELKQQRMIALTTNNPQAPADIKVINTPLDTNATSTFYERTIKAMYDISSVPQASGNVTSGGDTGQARLLGNGWEASQNQAQVDQTYLMRYERELLSKIIWICKNTAGCPVQNINACDITIKFNINMSNNLLVKAEAMKMLNEIGYPKKHILTFTGATSDVDGVGDAWERNVELEEQKELALANKEQNIGNNTTDVENTEEV